jgi:hypothetical protein
MTNIAQNKTTMRKEHHKTEESSLSSNNAYIAKSWHMKLTFSHSVEDPKARTNFPIALRPVRLKFQMRPASRHPQIELMWTVLVGGQNLVPRPVFLVVITEQSIEVSAGGPIKI